MRNYKPPLKLELFAHIMASYVLARAEKDQPVSYARLLEAHQLTIQQWAEGSAFWTPRINNPRHPAAFRYKTLLEEEARHFGERPSLRDAE